MHKFAIEYLGTMFLMFVILTTKNWLAIGAALAIAVLVGGSISGGAFNPAVTLTLYSSGNISKANVMPYILLQILGALSAFYLFDKFVK